MPSARGPAVLECRGDSGLKPLHRGSRRAARRVPQVLTVDIHPALGTREATSLPGVVSTNLKDAYVVGDSLVVGRIHIVFASFALVVAATSAPAQAPLYNPGLCSTEAFGQIVVRLESGLAFAFPVGDLHDPGYRPTSNREPVILEPEGCPRHPLIRSWVGVTVHPDRAQGVGLLGHEGPTRVQDITLRAFARCAANPANPVRRLSTALEECRVRRPDGSPEVDWTSFMRAVPGSHPEFAGQPFAVFCFGALHRGGGRVCNAGYQIEPGLSVSYRFHDEVVPREKISAFDLEIRALIAARRAPEYDLEAAE